MTVRAGMTLWSRFQGWLEARRPATLSLWGKLPTHADYLHHAAGPDAALAWQDWLSRHMPAPPRRRNAEAGTPWLHLTPAPANARAVPVAFVLPAGVLGFSGRQHVVGVMLDSRDSLGRHHPLLSYRCVSEAWVLAQGIRAGLPWWHAQAQLMEHWALLIDSAEPAATAGLPWSRLCDLATKLDSEPPEDAAGLHQELRRLLANTLLPASHCFHGVRHLPWPQWPHGMHGVAAQAAFWQQDAEGRVVSASHTLAELLRNGSES